MYVCIFSDPPCNHVWRDNRYHGIDSTFVAPEEGLFCKPKYRAIFCFIHFLFNVFRLLCLRFFNGRKDQSFRIFFLSQLAWAR